jgi:hypothetical protein
MTNHEKAISISKEFKGRSLNEADTRHQISNRLVSISKSLNKQEYNNIKTTKGQSRDYRGRKTAIWCGIIRKAGR